MSSVADYTGRTFTPYEPLPTGPVADFATSGEFEYPLSTTQEVFEDTSLTVRWRTTFRAVNLWVIYNQTIGESVQSQRQLSSSNSDGFYKWNDVSCSPDCSAPFVFRCVDTFGDEVEQRIGGFWSRRFWIRPAGDAELANGASTISRPSSTQSSTTLTNFTSSSAAITLATGSPPSVTAENPSTGTVSATPGTSPGPNTTAIGAGVGAGVGAVFLMLGAFFLWRRHNRKAKAKNGPGSSMSLDGTYSPRPKESKLPDYYPHATSEVPSWQSDPQELPP